MCTGDLDVVSYSCNFKETEEGGAAGTVYANWYDKEKGEYHLEKVGNGDPETELQEIFATKDQAISAAQAKFKRTKKSNQTFRFSTAGYRELIEVFEVKVEEGRKNGKF